jgi:hypothetical protein
LPGGGSIVVKKGATIAGTIRRHVQQVKKAAIVRAIRLGGFRTEAAEAAGIDRATMASWIEKDLEFAGRIAKAEAKLKNEILATNARVAKTDDGIQDRLFYLKTRAGLRERTEPDEVKISGSVDVSIVDGDGKPIKLVK